MNIAVLGATGRTGVPFVAAAVAAGHDVRALVRTPAKRSLLSTDAEHDVQRLLLRTGAGVRVDADEPKLLDRATVGVMRLLAADVLADGEQAVAVVRDSDTQWTVVRAPRLTDDEAAGDATASRIVGPDSGTKVSRADLAVWLLDELEDPSWVHAFPVVTW